MFLAKSAKNINIEAHVYSNTKDAPAKKYASKMYYGPFEDSKKLINFSKKVDVITYEFENVSVESLKKIKKLPLDTNIYCGHEYTFQNSNFCIANDSKNSKLKDKIIEIKKKLEKNLPTIPSILADELDCNIFLKAKDVKSFSKLRDLKDNF